MKKILFIIAVNVLSLVAKAQYPNGVQTIGNDSNIVQAKGAFKSRLINYSFTDTIQANTQRIKQYPGAQIFTTSDSNMWYRTPNANKWVQFFTNRGGTTGDTLVWKQSGNYVADRVVQPVLGTKTYTELPFITNDIRRMTIGTDGIQRTSGASYKYVMIDTASGGNFYLAYGDGGAGTTYTFTNGLTESGGTVKLGGTLTEATTTIDADGKNLDISNVSNFSVNGSGGDLSLYNERSGNSSSFNTDGSGFANIYSHVTASPANRSEMLFTPDSITIQPFLGRLIIDTLNYTLSTTGKKIMLRDTATGLVQNIDPALLGGSTAISALTAATGTNTIDNGAYSQRWEWNTLSGTGGTGLDLYSNSTAADFNAQTLFKATLQGANSNSTQTTQAAVIQNTHSGTSSTNIGLYVASTSGTNNYALIVPSSGGSVGIGTSTPTSLLHVNGTAQFGTAGSTIGRLQLSGNTSGTIGITTAAAAGTWTMTLPANDGDASQVLTTDGSGVTSWTTVSGGGTPAGNFGNLQIGRNGAFSTPASDSLDFDGGLNILGNLTASVQATTPLIYGSTAANGDLEIKGTSNATKTTSYVNLQSDGGNVGIGTSAPAAKLQVTGTTFLNGGLDIGDNAYYDANVAFSVKSSRAYLFNFYNTSAAIKMALTQTGRLSIGTTDGGSFLNVKFNSSIGDTYYNISAPTSGLIVEGDVGFGTSAPTANLHIGAGTASANTAPLKLTVSGAVLLTTPESGATEVLVDSIYYTGNNATRNRLAYATEIGSFSTKQGTDVASVAGAIVLGSGGNIFEITGTNAITLISNVRWQNGSEVTLIFTSTATLTDGTANSGTDIGMELAGNANFSASAGTVVKLLLSEIGGTQRWREVSRSIN